MVTTETAAKRPRRRPGAVAKAVDALLAGETLDDAGEAKAAIARALAKQLDMVTGTELTTSMVMATAGIAKELREVVDAILETRTEDGEFIADIFGLPSAVGDSS